MAVISSPKVSALGSVPAAHGPPGLRKSLAGLDDAELLGIVGSLPPGHDRRDAACELLVSRHRGLVRACVHRYHLAPGLAEDLMQVGYVGLLRAISNFDPAVGSSLAAYAVPCIAGEIKRHFRDKRWPVQVPRSVKSLLLQARDATRELTQSLGRTPTESDVAAHLGVTCEQLREARRAETAFAPSSLDTPLAGQPGTATLADLLGEDDPQLEHMLSMQAVASHWGELAPRERKILLMRFGGEMTQAQIGHQIGLSQMQVSRLLAHALEYLRLRILGQHETASERPERPAPGEVRIPDPALRMVLTLAAKRTGRQAPVRPRPY
jgi:RNA polymerase sigma-B factor